MARPVSFFTAQELVSYLNEDPSAGKSLSDLEQRIVDRVQRLTDRWFGPEKTVVSTWDVRGDRTTIWVANPINSLVSVEVGPTAALVGLTSLDLDEFIVDDNAVIRVASPFPDGHVRISYKAGYDEEDVPLAVKQDVLDLVAANWRTRLTSRGGPIEFVSVDVEIPAGARESLRRFAMPVGL